ncbi:MAG: serine hydrolase [Desulfobacca sp.]|uniref:serine hydrolase n=1 Tax=Desulfobacca sp. TaxID=2067990 RepID=UPI00404B9D84
MTGRPSAKHLVLFVLWFLGLSGQGWGWVPADLPLSVPPARWRPLAECQDVSLQKALTGALGQRPSWRELLAARRLAVGLVDLADPRVPRFAQVNGDTMMYAASLPKIVVLLAAFHGMAAGRLPETPQMWRELRAMIRESSNPAAAWLIQRLGLPYIQSILFQPHYRFYRPRQGGGLWVGSTFASGGPQAPEPLQDLTQAATATQVCRFYYLLASGRLLNPAACRQMLEIMAYPGLKDKFVAALDGTVPPDHLFRKNGTFSTTHVDSVLVWGQGWRRYILVGLVEDARGEQVLRELLPLAERVLRQSRRQRQ